MVDNRHRLNAVVFRRTQGRRLRPNGDPVRPPPGPHAGFPSVGSRAASSTNALMDYLRDGYNLAETAGNKGRALGFVMTIFQKIAASSFAAVGATLRRRLLMLTIHEAIVCDDNLDVDGRDRALNEARQLIRAMFNLAADAIGRAETDRLLADAKVQLLRKLGEDHPRGSHRWRIGSRW